jgi:hypothetical protein
MRSHRTIVIGLAIVAVLFWFALLTLMNRKPPDSMGKAVFLALWGIAVTCSVIPMAFAINTRWVLTLSRRATLARSVRQGVLAGALATLLMTLRFAHLLSLAVGMVLVVVVVLVELLVQVQGR